MVEQICGEIREYFVKQGKGTRAVIGISGGKDSSVAAALVCRALGPERVIAVKMPYGVQHDIAFSNAIIETLGIPEANVFEVNIEPICDAIYKAIPPAFADDKVVTSNLPARVRMTILYAFANAKHGRVINTSNRSEAYVGYTTKWGDNVGDYAVLQDLTATEVKVVGRALGLDEKFIEKPPEDGLSGLTDEANMGFTYESIDKVITASPKSKSHNAVPFDEFEPIELRHIQSEHKRCVNLPGPDIKVYWF